MGGSAAPRGAVAVLLRAGAAVTAANVVVNALAYLVPLLAARRLAPDNWGALATVMALLAIVTVPSLGVQTAVAVARSRGGSVANAGRLAALAAGLSGGAVLLATPLLVPALDLPVAAPPLLAALTVPVVLAGRSLGELQGAERFGRLAVGMLAVAVARYAGVIVGLLAGAGVVGALASGVAVAWLVPPLLARLGREPCAPESSDRGLSGRGRRSSGGGPAPGPQERGGVDGLRMAAVFTATSATFAMLAVSYADLILARHLLAPAASGAYAVGAVLTRGAIWAPQVVTLLLLPRLAQGRRHALGAGLGLLGGAGAALVAAAATASDLAVRLAGGARYGDLARHAPWFAALGALYAVAFFLLNARIAAGASRPAAPLWVALGVLAAALLLARPVTVGATLGIALGIAALATAAMGVAVHRDARKRVAPGPPDPTVAVVVTEP
jgi:hypothetical protein